MVLVYSASCRISVISSITSTRPRVRVRLPPNNDVVRFIFPKEKYNHHHQKSSSKSPRPHPPMNSNSIHLDETSRLAVAVHLDSNLHPNSTNHHNNMEPPKKQINLLRGWPSPHLLPASLLKSSATKVLSDPAIFTPALQYGPDPGYQPLREELASWLNKAYHRGPSPCHTSTTATTTPPAPAPNPNEICITGGASQSIANILASFTDPVYTKAVWAIAPCYFLACPIFEDAGFKGRLRAVPEDDEGVDIAWLERGLREFGDRGDGEKPVGVFLFCLCCTIFYDGGRSSGLVMIHDELLVFDPALMFRLCLRCSWSRIFWFTHQGTFTLFDFLFHSTPISEELHLSSLISSSSKPITNPNRRSKTPPLTARSTATLSTPCQPAPTPQGKACPSTGARHSST